VHQPQWSVTPPSPLAVEAFLALQEKSPFSYAEVGASNGEAPPGYNLDHNRVRIGTGEADFAAARAALEAWRMFPAPWTKISPAQAAIRVGQVVAMQANALGLWWLNACRIVYVIDEAAPVRRFGFAYGTLSAHVEKGEERFSVEHHPDGAVWYDVRAFSQPRYWPVRLGKPLARALQRRFVRDSQAAMQQAVRHAAHGP
jgi:uncharacterized protein (UPF0548 family)